MLNELVWPKSLNKFSSVTFCSFWWSWRSWTTAYCLGSTMWAEQNVRRRARRSPTKKNRKQRTVWHLGPVWAPMAPLQRGSQATCPPANLWGPESLTPTWMSMPSGAVQVSVSHQFVNSVEKIRDGHSLKTFDISLCKLNTCFSSPCWKAKTDRWYYFFKGLCYK